VTAPTPIKLRTITEAVTPAIIGLIRIDAGLSVLAFMIVFGSRAWRRTWAAVCNPCASVSLSNQLNGLFSNRESLPILSVSPADDGFRRPAKDRAEGKGILLSPCGDKATKRALKGFSPSRA
jgi:hypothetical protein